MKTIDRLLQRWRIAKVVRYLPRGSSVLDIGCADGALAKLVPGLAGYLGIDPGIENSRQGSCGRLIKGRFPEDLPDRCEKFDAITMLAVLEHIPTPAQALLAEACRQHLEPSGLLLITVPSPFVDYLLAALKFLRLIDGMSLEEHYGFDVRQTPVCFGRAGFALVAHRRFQLGLNHLFVFQAPAEVELVASSSAPLEASVVR